MSSSITELLNQLTITESSLVPESKLSTEELALKSQWETLTPERLQESLNSLNDSLRTKTYIVGNKPTITDITVFKAVFELACKITSFEDIAKSRHILRWIDLIQNTLITNLQNDDKLKINFELELPKEIKEKKKKEEAKKDDLNKKIEIKKQQNVAKKEESIKKANSKPMDEESLRLAKEAKEQKKLAKAKAKAESDAKLAQSQQPPNPSMIDFRVGFIEKAIKHPDADSLYVSTIQMGDSEGPRTVCSGLVKHFELQEMQERYVIVIANLKPVTMRGIKSSAMVLCASNAEDKVEFVNPPIGSKPGDKIFFEGYDGEPEKVLNPKKKIWETCQPNFSTNESFEVIYKQEGKPDAKLINKDGQLCKNSTIVNASVR
ncbi:hypothetical protein CANARDRAFT_200595 [[Candida] arabinofermentans NRRL YB-2248]|uniref:tRNA-binding domain-containing protein n=1 Tax=[Candida] arabinofermentans NRRL YB-2248 TaxID=983967 RepID=A0A1E4SYC2_9ASCO|nr:hypothetical protein CANARDRAFT_200595 [[Candida] arabinofermentans NRRL YB-2248]